MRQHVYIIKHTTTHIQTLYNNEHITTNIQHVNTINTTTCVQQHIYNNLYTQRNNTQQHKYTTTCASQPIYNNILKITHTQPRIYNNTYTTPCVCQHLYNNMYTTSNTQQLHNKNTKCIQQIFDVDTNILHQQRCNNIYTTNHIL